jgi:hypothetical protein
LLKLAFCWAPVIFTVRYQYQLYVGDSPGACPAGSWKCDPGYSLYEGRLSCTLPADGCNRRNIDVDIDAGTGIGDK